MQILLLITALLQLALLCHLEWRLRPQFREEDNAAPEESAPPDPEAARKAAEAINRFNAGVANILGYDADEEGSA